MTGSLDRKIPERPEPTMPCTGCGECCSEKICKWGIIAFPDADIPCPGLIWEEDRYWCALIKYQPKSIMAQSLGIGLGCSKNINLRIPHIDNTGTIEFILQEMVK